MRRPFLPDYSVNPEVATFNTLHMSTEEFGAFTLLAYQAWREDPPCSLPNDDTELARFARMTPERWAECKHRVLATFTPGSASRLYHKEMRQAYDKLRQKHAARVSAANVANNSRHGKPNGMNGFHTNRSDLHVSNGTHKLPQKVPIPPHPPGEEEGFSLTSFSSFSEKKEAASVVVQGALDSAVHDIAARMYARHPAMRRCSVAVIQKQLRSIVRKIHAVPEKVEKLREIDAIHEQWCASWEWTKEGGQFAKGLQNWLAPTKERWDTPPAESGGFGHSAFGADSKMAKTLLAFEVLPKL